MGDAPRRSEEHLAAVYLASWRTELKGLTRRAENRQQRGLPVGQEALAAIAELRARIAAVERGEEWDNPHIG
jgi:hypothetical protein